MRGWLSHNPGEEASYIRASFFKRSAVETIRHQRMQTQHGES